MIATISAQPIKMSHRQHRYANTAAGPLPILPRRASSTRQMATALPALTLPKRISDIPGSTAMRRSSSSSSSESDSAYPKASQPLSIRARRARTAQAQGQFPTALTTPIPPLSRVAEPSEAGGLRASKTEDNITLSASKSPTQQYLYSPGMSLRLGYETRSSSIDASKSSAGRAVDDSRLIRKKSGQLVKPSLKSSRSANGADSLSMFSSKSEPATPACKAVHFDSQLEHVKLFLAEQKPLAVSRDGSPTDDTSGTDSDFPSFIFGDDHDKRDRRRLNVNVVNMPPRINLYANVALEEVSVSPGNHAISGRIRVLNIAYAKTVAVRFTFDSWQTTSEVVGHYLDSPSSNFDRFSFVIKLDDLLARIEEKTLVLAIRYSVAGQEYWDNNGFQDYVVKFSRSMPRDRSLSDEESSENLVSLQNKLEKVVQGKDRSGSTFTTSSPRSSPDPEEPAFKSTSSFGARYDFNASLKSSWKYQDSAPCHQRNNSFPQSGKPIPSKPSLKDVPLGSPRDLTDDIPTSPVSAHTDDAPFEVPNREHGRKHHRGYFDMASFGALNIRRTPPTSPSPRSPEVVSPRSGGASPYGRFYSFPPLSPPKNSAPIDGLPPRPAPLPSGLFPDMNTGFDSELSTPSLTTPTSSRSTTPSPTEQFRSLPSSDDESPRNPDTHYRELISQYCFFTGGTQSASNNSSFNFNFQYQSVKQVDVSVSDSTPRAALEPRMRPASPVSSLSSIDDLVSMTSDSVTPTASLLNLNEVSRSPTPTVCVA
ncbi:hypothetical protein EST38_g8134 [Candolleomyces aberdarensis]|uniref:CBM21 domain-containing protein n=1 Tax=Candolleomyces aberdarensis TaxID=2316362 RepID=A0A4V1Q387_9AGAR|nr:hypothetical protein EST38_g8134 [Candolleomyces aberdarensis]